MISSELVPVWNTCQSIHLYLTAPPAKPRMVDTLFKEYNNIVVTVVSPVEREAIDENPLCRINEIYYIGIGLYIAIAVSSKYDKVSAL